MESSELLSYSQERRVDVSACEVLQQSEALSSERALGRRPKL